MEVESQYRWALPKGDVEMLPEGSADALLLQTSAPLRLPGQATGEVPGRLRRFEASALQHSSCTVRLPGGATATESFLLDAVAFTGGMVFKLGWVPRPGQARHPTQHAELLAVAVHPKGEHRHIVNEATAGPGVVQLWSVPETDTCAYGHGGLPACELLLHHGGRVVWDMAWCPDASAFGLDLAPDGPEQLPVLGLLALVLGDGSVQLVAVPDPLALRARAASADHPSQQQPHGTNDAAGAAPAPLEARVKPLVTLQGDAAGISGLPSCCAWDPSAPHERLIVGSWDGTCSLWTLPRAAAGQPALALHFRVDGMPTRRVQFFPPDALASSTGAHRHVVMTAGDSGVLRLWDLSTGQPWPLLSRNLGRNAIFDATVAAPPGLVSVLAAMEDGSLRHLHLDAIGLSFARDTAFEVLKGPGGGTACLWAIDCCRGAPLAGYCGEEGIVGLMAVQHELDARRRMPHAAIGALRCVPGGGLRVYTADEVPTPSGLYGGGGAYRKPAAVAGSLDFQDSLQTLYALRFSPNGGSATWLACGGTAGVLRFQRVSGKEG